MGRSASNHFDLVHADWCFDGPELAVRLFAAIRADVVYLGTSVTGAVTASPASGAG